MGQERKIADGYPIAYVTRREHDGIPVGSEVTALRRDGKIVLIYEGKLHELEDRWFLEGYEGESDGGGSDDPDESRG